jgi:hypothetical protein
MSRKRTKADSDLSGGLDDNNPQVVSISNPIPAFPVATQNQSFAQVINLPLPPASNVPVNKAIVFEVTKVIFELPWNPVNVLAVNPTWLISLIELVQGVVTPLPTLGLGIANSQVVAHSHKTWFDAGAAGGAGTFDHVQVIDLTDDAGHGIILPTGTFTLLSNNQYNVPAISTQATGAACKIYYRYKLVPLQEYIQMVGSLINLT